MFPFDDVIMNVDLLAKGRTLDKKHSDTISIQHNYQFEGHTLEMLYHLETITIMVLADMKPTFRKVYT